MAKPDRGQKKVTTVWLDSEIGARGNDKVKMFFCPNCRIPIIQYTGNIATIVPGGSPYIPSTILKCKGSVQNPDGTWEECGHLYSFVASVYTKDPQET